jgi:hypothetical protein
MILIRRLDFLIAAILPALGNPSLSWAQLPKGYGERFAIDVGLSSLPDGLSTQCGSRGGPDGGGGGPEVGAALTRHLTRFFMLRSRKAVLRRVRATAKPTARDRGFANLWTDAD